MKQLHRLTLYLFCLSCLLLGSFGVAGSVDEVMQASGVTKQLDSFPDMLKAGINESRLPQAGPANPVNSVIVRAVDQSIQPIIIRNNIRNLLEKEMTGAELDALLAWYRSSLGKRITAAEEKASTAESYSQLPGMADRLLQDEERMALMGEIDEVIRATEFSYELQVGTQVGLVAAMTRIMKPDNPVDINMMREKIRSQELEMKQVLHRNVMVSLSYTYRDFTDEEIRHYIDFLETPEARKFNTLATQELKESLLRGMSVLGENVARGMKAQTMLP